MVLAIGAHRHAAGILSNRDFSSIAMGAVEYTSFKREIRTNLVGKGPNGGDDLDHDHWLKDNNAPDALHCYQLL